MTRRDEPGHQTRARSASHIGNKQIIVITRRAAAGLPPAHVGLHAGPVVFQEGDYYGQTVNLASRIDEYARPGEVLVSQAVIDASPDVEASLTGIGPVDFKGVAVAMQLQAAHRQPETAEP
jgi:class 3 adenylate cyclase